MSSLTPDQLQTITTWAAEGANLNQIQDRLRTEFAITLTYMEARLLVLELGLKLQDKPREKPPEEKLEAPTPAPEGEFQDTEYEQTAASEGPAGSLSVTEDEIPPAGAIISGTATFSDGTTVMWFMDQTGRFGMRGPAPGYQPPPADIPAFQSELDRILTLRGF